MVCASEVQMSLRVLAIFTVLSMLGCGDKGEVEPEDEEEESPEPTAWYPDEDGDGFGVDALGLEAVTAPDDHVAVGGDCDDTDPAIHPDADEVCNEGVDDDCDGLADDDDDSVVTDSDDDGYLDEDGDGYAGAQVVRQCDHTDLFESNEDCDDGDDDIHPEAAEDCGDGVDQDCDGLLDCEDGECAGLEPCVEGLGTCNDGVDNDEDGLRDCADDECWALGLCGEVRVRVTDADGLFHVQRSSSDYYFAFGRYSYQAEDWHTMAFTGVRGQFAVVRPSGSSSCGWTLDAQTAQWVKKRWSGTGSSHLGSAVRSGFAADSSCHLVDPEDFMISTMAPTTWRGLPDGVIASSGDHSVELWAAAAGWSGTTSVRSSHFRGIPGSDGYGYSVYYSTGWWNRTMTRSATAVTGGDTWVWDSVYVGAGP